MNKQALIPAHIVANNGAYQSIGSQIAPNMRRYVYFIKATNQVVGANELSIARGPAAAEVVIDTVQAVLQYDIWEYPEALPENAAPIYIFEAANQFIRVITDNGNMDVFILFADEP